MVVAAQARRAQAETWTGYVEALFSSDPVFTDAVRRATRASRCFEAARQVWGVGGHRPAARRLLLWAVLDAIA